MDLKHSVIIIMESEGEGQRLTQNSFTGLLSSACTTGEMILDSISVFYI